MVIDSAIIMTLYWALANAEERLLVAYYNDGDTIGPQIAIDCYRAKLKGLIKP